MGDEHIKEIAIEEGMLHGIDAYNDAMGSSLGEPVEHGHHCPFDCECYEEAECQEDGE